MTREEIDNVLARILSAEEPDKGNARVKEVVNRLLKDLFYAIEDLDISSEEYWKAMDWFSKAGSEGAMFGLITAGLGIEHFLDVRMDSAESKSGIEGATPRTIEGPLYVAGAPEAQSYAELEDIPEKNAERLYMQGQVLDEDGNPVEGALVEAWHCNLKGLYSYFDSTQPPFNLRRGIRTAEDGKYQFKSFLPVGYSVPPGSAVDTLMATLGRHGSRPAHIHFFITAPGFRKLTTQINIADDPLVGQDFAFADLPELTPEIVRVPTEEAKEKFDIDEAFAKIDWDFKIQRAHSEIFDPENHRTRAVVSK